MKDTIVRYLESIIYWSIVLIFPSIALAPAFTSFVLSILFTSFFVKKLLKKEKFAAGTSIDLPFFAFLLISSISILNSIDYASSIKGIFKLVKYALMYLIFVEELKDKRHIKRIILGMLIGASLASVDAIWQIISGHDFIRGHSPIVNIGLNRATAAFPNANVLGVFLSAVSPLAFGLALYYLKAQKRILMFIISGLILIGIVLTFSRPAALAFYLSILFLAIVKKDKVAVPILIIFLLLTPFMLPTNIKEWAREVNYDPIVFMCNSDRVSTYRNTINMIKHHPVIGVGLNTFSKNYFKYKLPEPPNAKTGDTMYAHNNFLHMAGETGLVGLAAFIWLLWRLFSYCIYLYKNLKDEYVKILSLCLTASAIAFLINGLTETNLYYSRVAIMFWYIVGFVLSLNKFLIREN